MNGDDVVCVVKNSATLAGSLFTLHASQVHIDMPTLTEKDKEVSYSKFMTIAKNDVHVTYDYEVSSYSIKDNYLRGLDF